MKMFIPLLCLLSFTIAEPPVGDSYASARSSHSLDHTDFQRSPSTQYGVPSSRNSLTTEYGPPRSRSSARLSSSYGPPKPRISEEYGAPNARSSKNSQEYGASTRNSPSQEYGVPTRNAPSQKYGAPSSGSRSTVDNNIPSRSNPSQEYGIPKSSSSQEYSLPETRNLLSQDYGAPSARNSPSQEYGLPARTSNQEYGLPNAKSRQSSSYQSRNIETSNPSSLYGAPRQVSEEYRASERNALSQKPSSQYLPQKNVEFGKNHVSKAFNSKKLSQYSAPKSKLATSYGVPSASSDYSQDFSDFGAKDLSDTYGAPASSPSQEYGVPKAADLKTDAVASSYSSASSRSSATTSYGTPSARDSMPSDQYGVPEQYNTGSNQGYEYGRASDEDYQEPANYEFVYKVNDYITGSDFGHKETRQDNRAEGTYFVVLPDGNKQVVEYEADERGFKPRISVEPVETSRSGGYDDNAADLNDSEGPY